VDFFERWLHICPDNGSGMLEILSLGVLATIAAAIKFRKYLFRGVSRLDARRQLKACLRARG
jgi:hypothetical protein